MEKRVIKIGDRVEKSYLITGEMIDAFADMTKDYNAIHMDEEYAKMQGFDGRVCHGMLTTSLASTVMGMELPGPGTVLMDMQVKFQHPICENEKITIEVTLDNVDERYRNYIGTMEILVVNQEGLVALKATARQRMPKNAFEIELGE